MYLIALMPLKLGAVVDLLEHDNSSGSVVGGKFD
jgi:hypothetical protein